MELGPVDKVEKRSHLFEVYGRGVRWGVEDLGEDIRYNSQAEDNGIWWQKGCREERLDRKQ